MRLALFLLLPALVSAVCINAGGPATFQPDGVTVDCVADTGFSGGTPYIDTGSDPGTLRTLRYGTFSYVIPAAVPGFYWLSLTFQDPNVIAPGGRVFSITINGQRSTNIDLGMVNAGIKKPYTLRLPVISYGQVTIAFATVIRSAIVNELRLEPFGYIFSTQAQAEAGIDTTTIMTPERTAQAITAQTPVPLQTGHTHEFLSTNGFTATWARPWDPESTGRRILAWLASGDTNVAPAGTNWSLAGDGSAANVDPTINNSQSIHISSGAMNANAEYLNSSSSRPFRAGKNISFSARITLGSSANLRMWAGVGEDPNPFQTSVNGLAQAILFRYAADVDATFQCLTRGPSSFTLRDSGVTADTNQHDFRWTVNDATGSVRWWIDGLEVCTTNPTGNLPVNINMGPSVGVSTLTASNSAINLSWIVFEADN